MEEERDWWNSAME